MTCPNCLTRIPVLLEQQVGPGHPKVLAFKGKVIETTEQLQAAIRELSSSDVRILVPPTPSEASKLVKRPLTTIAGELRQALEEQAKAEELSREADRAQRTAAHYKVDAMRRVHRLRYELTATAEGNKGRSMCSIESPFDGGRAEC